MFMKDAISSLTDNCPKIYPQQHPVYLHRPTQGNFQPKKITRPVPLSGQGAGMDEYELTVKVDLRSPEYASIVQQVISVDDEPRPDRIRRTITSDGTAVNITFRSNDLKLIRTASSGLLDLVSLSIQVIDRFSPEAVGETV